MESIFTYNDDPPRVASPWSLASQSHDSDSDSRSKPRHNKTPLREVATPVSASASDSVTRLSAEPQTGPTEYKLHLLLRPRRHAASSSSSPSLLPRIQPSLADESPVTESPPLAASNSTRQHRLEQLTTQLLWRLQQSSPFNSSTSSNLILPTLPEASSELRPPQRPSKLVPGLEESKGALYEIGVADDGTFVGLTKEEMSESLNNLQAMAASLGCLVEVLRMVPINESEGSESGSGLLKLRDGVLYVAEAYVKPVLDDTPDAESAQSNDEPRGESAMSCAGTFQAAVMAAGAREQLRVTLTGATTCGKSSLLGTLSTSVLDNGRGLSRLNLLKHRHEIASGVTSSVAQQLIGYQSQTGPAAVTSDSLTVVNYATKGVSSWNGIHTASGSGRLAFLSDSAGHPRYRRTTVRGLVGCAPHWTMLCMAACESSDAPTLNAQPSPDAETRTFPGASAHLSMAHLDLCLKLQLPLVVVITKLDAASKATFRQMLSTLLTTLKTAGRKPQMVANDSREVTDQQLQHIPQSDVTEIQRLVAGMGGNAHLTVPIVFTSAVNGTGIGKVHALLRYLPIIHPYNSVGDPPVDEDQAGDDAPTTLFHVDDVFDLELAKTPGTTETYAEDAKGFIVSGLLSRGTIAVGQELVLGPFSHTASGSSDEPDATPPSNTGDPFLTPRSFTDALAKITSPSQTRVVPAEHEWRIVKIISIRNLRLPLRVLQADRVGTIGLVPIDATPPLQIRRGMVLSERQVPSVHTMTAAFDLSDANSMTVGSRVVIYSATIRSAAKILTLALDKRKQAAPNRVAGSNEEFTFGMDEDMAVTKGDAQVEDCIVVTLQLDAVREVIEAGTSVLLMPGGGPGLHAGDRGTRGLAGLEGFVGRVVDTFG